MKVSSFKIIGHSRPPLSSFLSLNTVDSLFQNFPMTGFEPQTTLPTDPQLLPKRVVHFIKFMSRMERLKIFTTNLNRWIVTRWSTNFASRRSKRQPSRTRCPSSRTCTIREWSTSRGCSRRRRGFSSSWKSWRVWSDTCGQSYKHFTLVNYDSRLENTPYYDPRVVIYERKMFIRLATDGHTCLWNLQWTILVDRDGDRHRDSLNAVNNECWNAVCNN